MASVLSPLHYIVALSCIPYAELRQLEDLFERDVLENKPAEPPSRARYDSLPFSSSSRPLPVHLNRRSGYLGLPKSSR